MSLLIVSGAKPWSSARSAIVKSKLPAPWPTSMMTPRFFAASAAWAQAALDRILGVGQLRHPARYLLPQGHGGGVLQVGTSHFDNVSKRLRLAREGGLQRNQSRKQFLGKPAQRRQMHGGRKNVIGGLPQIHMIVGMYQAIGTAPNTAWKSTSPVSRML